MVGDYTENYPNNKIGGWALKQVWGQCGVGGFSDPPVTES